MNPLPSSSSDSDAAVGSTLVGVKGIGHPNPNPNPNPFRVVAAPTCPHLNDNTLNRPESPV
jgi:hypothetical protein